MRYMKLFLFLLTVLISATLTAFGQDGPPPDDARPPLDRADDRRPNLLAELGLSPEQVEQLRRLNRGRRAEMMRAQHRVGEATKALDGAIYADTFSDADYQARLKEFQNAQAEVARLRFENELSIRRVLTPEQLVKFRTLRDEVFARQRRENMRNRRDGRGGRGFAPRREPPPNKPPN